MSKKTKGLYRINQRIKERIRRKEKARRVKKNKKCKKETTRTRAAKLYNAWLKTHEASARLAADTTWAWYKEFIASKVFKRLVAALEGNSWEIRISKVIVCEVPYRDCWSTKMREQVLGITAPGRLFVHNLTKYGNSHRLKQKDDLLEFVAWPVLIEVAETITKGTIWDIIDIS